ncbi:hypothetical protein PYW08_003941 [Mythimna loreyi]|uniref:Uncharacterized protein n=1 Tax=Mythimna loreyi TaxID=667449 RepID=A0ACC2QWQ5_9NEOP|nr:hypothetical protein PYW08_003941 [Mythimna loreyi]
MLFKSVNYFLIIIWLLVEIHAQDCVTPTIGENCEPKCGSNCTNGSCKIPGECVCNPGYTRRNDACEPLCEPGCLHGSCVAPNICRCNSGYKLVDGTCQPVCTLPCENGTCTAPDTCECNSGYYKRYYSYPHTISCEPRCPLGCPLNGHCDAPGICKCNPGWRMNEFTRKCMAVCKYPCGNGICLLPDRCLCARGYQINYSVQEGNANGPVCEPIYYYGSSTRGVPVKNASEKMYQSGNSELSTTTTKDPLKTTSTYSYNRNHDENSSTTTTVSASVSSGSTDIVVDNAVNVTSPEKSWIQRNGLFICIPLVVVVTAGLILLLVWRRIPIIVINYFKRRSYNVQEAFLKRSGSGAYETVHIIREEKETQCL